MNIEQASKKEVRQELQVLVRSEKKIRRDCAKEIKAQQKLIASHGRAIKRTEKACSRALERISKRIAILQGRLS